MFFDLAADGGQLGRSAIVKCAVRKNLVAEAAQENGEIRYSSGKLRDSAPVGFQCGWRMQCHFPPLRRPIHHHQNFPNLARLECGAFDPRLLYQAPGII